MYDLVIVQVHICPLTEEVAVEGPEIEVEEVVAIDAGSDCDADGSDPRNVVVSRAAGVEEACDGHYDCVEVAATAADGAEDRIVVEVAAEAEGEDTGFVPPFAAGEDVHSAVHTVAGNQLLVGMGCKVVVVVEAVELQAEAVDNVAVAARDFGAAVVASGHFVGPRSRNSHTTHFDPLGVAEQSIVHYRCLPTAAGRAVAGLLLVLPSTLNSRVAKAEEVVGLEVREVAEVCS